MAYIIRRTDQGGGFVAPSGSHSSYVSNPHHARVFDTVGDAKRSACPDNEVVMEFFPSSLRPVPR